MANKAGWAWGRRNKQSYMQKYTKKQNSAIREDKKELIPNAYSKIEYIQSLEKDGDIV